MPAASGRRKIDERSDRSDPRVALVMETLPGGKMRLTASGWDVPKLILVDQVLEVRPIGKQLYLLRRPRPPTHSTTA